VGLELLQGGLEFPALVIERGQLGGGGLVLQPVRPEIRR
jgi:hypothetical protein